MASVATMRSVSLSTAGASPAAALTGGSQLALELAAGFVVLAIVVALTVLPAGSRASGGARASDEDEAPRFDAMPDAA
jgi:hypothetical protein